MSNERATPSALTFARLLGEGPMARVALQASLDLLASPAFIVSRRGTVLYANRRGQAELEKGGDELRASLARSARSGKESSDGRELVTALRCEGAAVVYFLVTLRSPTSLEENVALVTQLWELTEKQRAVLQLVAEGYANKTIAQKLRCTERTVESHLTQIFQKSGTANRTALVAAVARERP